MSGRELRETDDGCFVVVRRTWNSTQRTRYADYPTARKVVMNLRARGFSARIEVEGDRFPDEEPEHRGDRLADFEERL